MTKITKSAVVTVPVKAYEGEFGLWCFGSTHGGPVAKFVRFTAR